MRKLMTFGVALFMLVTLVACGKGTSSADGKVELRISWWGGDSRNEAVQAAIKEFEKENPEIKVKAEFGGYGGYQEKMTTQLSGGTAPDVIRLDSMWMNQYQNNLLDLNDVAKEIGLDNFDKKTLTPVSEKGKVLGIPLSTNYRGLYYNKTVLDQYGIEKPASWEDLYAMREKLPEDMYPLWAGFSQKGVTPVFFFALMAQQTGKPIADENNKLIYTEKDFQNVIAFYEDLVAKKIIPSKKVIDNAGMVDGAPIPDLVNGKWVSVFEFVANTNVLNSQLKEKGFELALAGFPTLENQKSTGVWTKPSMVYSIPTASKNQKEAAKLIDFLVNSEAANKAQKLENGVPDSKTGKATLESEGLITPLVSETIDLGSSLVDPTLSNVFKWDRAKLNDVSLDVITELDYGKITGKEAAKKLYTAFKEEKFTE
ncbi:ABC transporter substrate-binding protein [Carnobacterium gallinarum]|uniref:ABC transporter substrate-binding protein n=1 Tax=Carnobacterium gallinarum TaxID=2749 RepID=UPI0005584867|nr:extracellular solute-binding protein [Carnobacterium gallinarum]